MKNEKEKMIKHLTPVLKELEKFRVFKGIKIQGDDVIVDDLAERVSDYLIKKHVHEFLHMVKKASDRNALLCGTTIIVLSDGGAEKLEISTKAFLAAQGIIEDVLDRLGWNVDKILKFKSLSDEEQTAINLGVTFK